MDWVGILVSVGSPFAAPLLDPRRISSRSDLGKALKRVGRRGRDEVKRALRDGRAVADPHLAGLAAALAEEQMRLSDYRGPPRRQEVLTLIAGAGALALVGAFGRHEPGVLPAFVGVYSVVVIWVVGLRRLIPSHRHTTDRLLIAYRANASLAEKAGPGELERVRFGMP
jgi:hypothetical protein